MRFLRPTLALLSLGALMSAPAAADMIREEMIEQQKKYDAGDVPGALDSARLIETWLMEQQAENLSGVFGQVSGWELTVGEAQAVNLALVGGGVTASALYQRGDDEMSAEIIANSPLLAMVSAMINNSFLAVSSGNKIVKIAGRKAMVEQTGERWKISVPYESQVLLTVQGPDRAAAEKCVEKVKWDLIDQAIE